MSFNLGIFMRGDEDLTFLVLIFKGASIVLCGCIFDC